MTNRWIGISQELIGHHLRLHAEKCPAKSAWIAVCPCGVASGLLCATCNETLLVGVAPGTWCEHAEEATQ
jgi:hypothetical protein